MKLKLVTVLAALAFALAPATRLDAQAPAHAGRHAQHHGEHAARKTDCAHAGGAHAATPAMLLMHRSDLGLTDAQAQRLRALKQDDAAGARAVLTAEQQARLEAMHAAHARSHAAAGHEHGADCCRDGECAEDCCKDGECRGEECCDDADCCSGGRCSEQCRECCERMGAGTGGAQAAPRS